MFLINNFLISNLHNVLVLFLTDEKLFGSAFTIKITLMGDSHDVFYSFVSCDERFGKPDTHICDRNSVPRHTSSYASIKETKKYIKYS